MECCVGHRWAWRGLGYVAAEGAWFAGWAAFVGLLCGLLSLPTHASEVSGAPPLRAVTSAKSQPNRIMFDTIRALPCKLVKGPRHSVVRAVQGDTVELDDGSRVRLIGTLTPRPPSDGLDAPEWSPMQQAEQQLHELTTGRSIQLAYDKLRSDRYGRVLAHLLVEPRVVFSDGEKEADVARLDAGSDAAAPPEKQLIWLQAQLVADGTARVVSYPETRACTAALLALEVDARRAKRGLWSHAAYAVRPAHRAKALLRYEGSFQLVSGTVKTVARVGRRVFINFGKRWRNDFTVVVEGRSLTRFKRAAYDFEALKGQRIRVRGWIESWTGPLIRATHPEQIERIGSSRSGRNRNASSDPSIVREATAERP